MEIKRENNEKIKYTTGEMLKSLKNKNKDGVKVKEGKVGILKGEVIEIKGEIVKIKTVDGEEIRGKSQSKGVKLGDYKTFEVYVENGVLKMKEVIGDIKDDSKVKNALKELGVIKSEENVEICNKLIENKLPITKEMIRDLNRIIKILKSKDIKVENKNVETFLLKHKIDINIKNVINLDKYSKKEVNIEEEITSLEKEIKKLEESEIKKQLETILKGSERIEINKSNVVNIIKEIIKERDIYNELEKMIKGTKRREEGDKSEIKKGLMTDVGGDKKNQTVEIMNKNKKDVEDVKKAITKLIKEEIEGDKNDEVKKIIKSGLEIKNIFKLLEYVDKEELVKIVKNAVKNKEGRININRLNKEEVKEKIEDQYRKVNEILEKVKGKEEGIEKIVKQVEGIKEKLEFINLVKEGSYVQIPVDVQGKKVDLEIIMFKGKSKNKNKKGDMTALISLNMNKLGLVESYVRKRDNKVNIQFRIKKDDVREVIEKEKNKLYKMLEVYGYNVESITTVKSETGFTIIDEEKVLVEEIGDNNVDIKI